MACVAKGESFAVGRGRREHEIAETSDFPRRGHDASAVASCLPREMMPAVGAMHGRPIVEEDVEKNMAEIGGPGATDGAHAGTRTYRLLCREALQLQRETSPHGVHSAHGVRQQMRGVRQHGTAREALEERGGVVRSSMSGGTTAAQDAFGTSRCTGCDVMPMAVPAVDVSHQLHEFSDLDSGVNAGNGSRMTQVDSPGKGQDPGQAWWHDDGSWPSLPCSDSEGSDRYYGKVIFGGTTIHGGQCFHSWVTCGVLVFTARGF